MHRDVFQLATTTEPVSVHSLCDFLSFYFLTIFLTVCMLFCPDSMAIREAALETHI